MTQAATQWTTSGTAISHLLVSPDRIDRSTLLDTHRYTEYAQQDSVNELGYGSHRSRVGTASELTQFSESHAMYAAANLCDTPSLPQLASCTTQQQMQSTEIRPLQQHAHSPELQQNIVLTIQRHLQQWSPHQFQQFTSQPQQLASQSTQHLASEQLQLPQMSPEQLQQTMSTAARLLRCYWAAVTQISVKQLCHLHSTSQPVTCSTQSHLLLSAKHNHGQGSQDSTVVLTHHAKYEPLAILLGKCQSSQQLHQFTLQQLQQLQKSVSLQSASHQQLALRQPHALRNNISYIRLVSSSPPTVQQHIQRASAVLQLEQLVSDIQ